MLWRLIESPPSDIFSQMALDRDLFRDFLQNQETQPTLRIYRVTQPALTVGYSYRKRLDRAGFLERLFRRLPLCVRPTGGGLVEHGKDLIYSVIARRDSFPTFHQVRTSYLSFHEAVQGAFRKLGIETHLLRCDEARRAHHYETECFTHPVATDVIFQEKKIAGGAQRRKGDAFLHQGSIQILDGITFADLRQAFVEAFECQLGAMWQEAPKEVKI